MKTDSVWIMEYNAQRGTDNRTLRHGDGSYVRAIQLDAVKHGMMLAAGMLIEDGNPMAAKDRIIAAADNLKEV